MPYWTFDDAGQLVYINTDGSLYRPDDLDYQVMAEQGARPKPVPREDTLDPYAGPPSAELRDPYAGGASAAVRPPTQSPQPSQPPRPQSGGVSYSYSGYDEGKVAGARGRAQQGFQEIESQAAQEFDTLAAPHIAAAEAKKRATARPEEVAGAPSVLAATVNQMAGQRRANLRMADFERRMADEEMRAEAASEVVVQQARQEYYNQVQTLGAMQIDPNQLWVSAGSGGRAQMLAAAFLEGYLSPVGVKVSAMDTINRMIDRNIDAQVANVNKQGQMVGHFRDLLELARSQSATEREARERLRGFHMAALKSEILAEMAKYDAPLAQAKAAEFMADIDAGLAEKMTNIDDMVRTRALQARNQYVTMRGQDISAAQHREEMAYRYAELAARSMPADANQPVDPGNLAFDPEGSGAFGVMIGDETAKSWTRKMLEGAAQMQHLAKEYKEVVERSDPLYDGPLGKLSQDAAESELRALHSRYISAKVLFLSGKAATNQERRAIEEQMPIERWMRSDIGATMAQEVANNHYDIQSVMNSRILSLESMVEAGLMTPQQYQQAKRLRPTEGGLPTSRAMNTEAQTTLGKFGATDPQNTWYIGALKRAQKPLSGPDWETDAKHAEAIRKITKKVKDPEIPEVLKALDALAAEQKSTIWNARESAFDLAGPMKSLIDRYRDIAGVDPELKSQLGRDILQYPSQVEAYNPVTDAWEPVGRRRVDTEGNIEVTEMLDESTGTYRRAYNTADGPVWLD